MIQTADGGYALAQGTTSYGAGNDDFFILKIGADGSYPGCTWNPSPTATTPSPVVASPGGFATPTFTQNNPSPTVNTPSISVSNICTPLYDGSDESEGQRQGITCSLVSGGVAFRSPEALPVKIYSADGRVAYAGELEEGENRVSLDQGVYLWRAGAYRWKAVVR